MQITRNALEIVLHPVQAEKEVGALGYTEKTCGECAHGVDEHRNRALYAQIFALESGFLRAGSALKYNITTACSSADDGRHNSVRMLYW